MMRKAKNYINAKGEYINLENKSLYEIWLEGYERGRMDKEKTEKIDKARRNVSE